MKVTLHALAALFMLLAGGNASYAQPPPREILVEAYVRSGDRSCSEAHQTLLQCLNRRAGVAVVLRDLDGSDGPNASRRLQQIAGYFQLNPAQLPIVYACNRAISVSGSEARVDAQLAQLFRIDVFTREGCPHCQAAKRYLQQIAPHYPGFAIHIRDIVRDHQARSELDQLVRRYRRAAVSVPVFHLCGELIVGFEDVSTSAARIESVLNRWTREVRAAPPHGNAVRYQLIEPKRALAVVPVATVSPRHYAVWQPMVLAPPVESGNSEDLPLPSESPAHQQTSDSFNLPLPSEGPGSQQHAEQGSVPLPWIGTVYVKDLGLPLFTVVVGLVDGFNPCAMWVLLLLLSILVNLRDRWRILAVAGTFVAISGLAYFAFMAAWLNVFLLVGLLRPVQVTLAVIAILIGSIHVKDFFAFKEGISLSIPESAKPGIYQRMRRIVTAENVPAALTAAAVLAVLVNIVELLCTAGLPAMYTQVLVLHELDRWRNYAYLGLYILAYMFDDSLMVALVVIALGKRKMQQQQGRWLKLVSGTAILILGVVMLARPDWLVW